MPHIGPFGRLLPFRSHAAGSPLAHARPSSQVTLLSGRVVTQRAAVSSRTWDVPLAWATPGDVETLLDLERGVYGPGPFWFLPPEALTLNMLRPEHAIAGMGVEPAGRFVADPDDLQVTGQIELGGGRAVAYSIQASAAIVVPSFGGQPDPLPVLPGETYTGSCYIAEGSSSAVRLTWVDADGVTVDTDTDDASADGRHWVSGVAPQEAAGVLLQIDTDGQVAALQVTCTPGLVRWQSGPGVARVTLAGMQEALQLIEASRHRTDVTVQLVEVG